MVHITKSKDIVCKEQQWGVFSQSKSVFYKETTLQVAIFHESSDISEEPKIDKFN